MEVIEKDWGKLYETEVLILGTGASGIGAALGAAAQGADVLMVGKGTLESSGSLGGGNDHFMAVLDTDEENDNRESFVNFYMKSAFGYRRSQLEQWHGALKPCKDILEQVGVEFKRRPEDGFYFRSVGFGQPGAWWLHIPNGRDIKRKLAKRVRKLGVHVLDNFFVTRLFRDGDRIAGCMGFDVLTGEISVIRCKTAVNSLGWHVQRATNNSSHNPYNCWFTPFTTGGYFTLAYDIGVPIINPDSARGTILPKGWGAPGMNGINNMGGYELNALGQRFMSKYDPMLENGTRRNQMMGTVQEQVEGNGPPFYMDMRHLSKEDVRHLQYVLMPADKETYLDYCAARGIEFSEKPLEVEVGELCPSGMLMADDNLETPVKGLYAGCNFTSFSGAMCGGYVAGGHAARNAKKVANSGNIPEERITAEKERIFRPMQRPKGGHMNHGDFENPIRQVMDYYGKFRRNMAGMALGLDRLNFIATYKDRVRAENLHDLMRIHEAFELLDVCRMHLDACLQRRESGRTMYHLSDYPEKDPALAKALIVSKGEDGRVFSWLEETESV